MAALLRLGTRGSPLALAQAEETRRRLAERHALPLEAIAVQVIKTTGDLIQDRSLSEAGGKALFTKELERALQDREIDLAVHSAKDMPTLLPRNLVIAAYLPREDVRDALIAPGVDSFSDLPKGGVVGTASLRRQAQVKRLRPDLTTVLFRGNVETRLAKLASKEADATLLALAGLKRLGLADHADCVLDTADFLPAVGQGAICVEAREDDAATRALIEAIGDGATKVALDAERAFLAILDGSCRTPIAGHARFQDGALRFHGMILKPDGSEFHEAHRTGAALDAVRMGEDAGRELKARGGPSFFMAV